MPLRHQPCFPYSEDASRSVAGIGATLLNNTKMENLTKIQEIEKITKFVNSLPKDSYLSETLAPILGQIVEGIKQDIIFDPNAEIEYYKGFFTMYINENFKVKNAVREIAELKETVALTENKLSEAMYRLAKIQDYCK